MLINKKIRLSWQFWTYCAAQRLAVSGLGGLFFRLTKKKIDPEASSLGKFQQLWWHFYLLRFAYRLTEADMKKMAEYENCVTIRTVDDFDYAYWNNCFHTNCMGYMLYELANGYIPVIYDRALLYQSFFCSPISCRNKPAKQQQLKGHLSANFKYAPYSKISMTAWQNTFKYLVKFNQKTEAYIQQEVEEIIHGRKILGVILRGTDYVNKKPKGHNRQPSIEKVIQVTRKFMDRYHYEYIYVASEDKQIVDAFYREFPNKILENKRTYYDELMKQGGKQWITQVKFDRENDDYLKGLEYMSSMVILSKCDALVGGNAGGARFALYLNGGQYSHIHIFDEGIY